MNTTWRVRGFGRNLRGLFTRSTNVSRRRGDGGQKFSKSSDTICQGLMTATDFLRNGFIKLVQIVSGISSAWNWNQKAEWIRGNSHTIICKEVASSLFEVAKFISKLHLVQESSRQQKSNAIELEKRRKEVAQVSMDSTEMKDSICTAEKSQQRLERK